MSKNSKWLLVILGVLLVIFIGVFGFYLVYKLNGNEEKNKIQIEVLDEINDYGYSLTSLDSKYYKEEFEALRDILSKEEIDKEAYAKAVAKLFIMDLFSLDTKVNKYDVGGDIYYYSEDVKLNEYKKKIVEEFYNLLEDNTYGDRKQELPLVKEIEVSDYKIDTYILFPDTEKQREVSCYVVDLNWSYEKDLGYDKEGTVILIDNGKKIEVVEYKAKTN